MPNLGLKEESISVEELPTAEIVVVRCQQRQNFARWMIVSTDGDQPLKLRNESSTAAVTVCRMISKCVSCRRRHSQPGRQLMAEFQPTRLQIDTTPFSHVGVGCFGPLKCLRKQVKSLDAGV